jgi:hypothetical protein
MAERPIGSRRPLMDEQELNELAWVYAREVALQTEFALRHWNQVVALHPNAIADMPGLFMQIQGFLNAAANVSKLLFPPGPEVVIEGTITRRDRGRLLRDRLLVADDSPLHYSMRAVRDDGEHIDQRLDAWVAGPGGPGFADMNIEGTPNAFGHGLGSESVFRLFRTYQPGFLCFQDHELPLGPLLQELIDVHSRAAEFVDDEIARLAVEASTEGPAS